jgi:hypothetical protein
VTAAPERVPPAPPQGQGPAPGPNLEWSAAPGGLPGLPGAQEAYSPVSLLAVAGFALAVVYAVLVALGGLAAFAVRSPRPFILLVVLAPLLGALGAHLRRSQRIAVVAGLALAGTLAGLGVASLLLFAGSSPWLLPEWTLVMPIGAALLSWMAQLRIRSSEGTLGGTLLARWGLGLSLVFGLYYAAYVAATTFAVRQQADTFARQWLGLLEQGEVQRAFLYTLPPANRPPEGAGQRSAIEIQHNTPRSAAEPGMYSRFTQSELVRLLALGGEDTKVERKSADWKYDRQTYEVDLRYQVSTPQGSFELALVVHGSQASDARAGGRQWFVFMPGTGMRSNVQPSPQGEALHAATLSAHGFARQWTQKVQQRELDKACRDTLPAAQRKRKLSTRDTKPFYSGELVRAEPDTFFVPARERRDLARDRAQIIQAVKRAFDPKVEESPQFVLGAVPVPLVRRDGDEMQLRLDVRLMFRIPDPAGGSPSSAGAEGYLVLAGSPDEQGRVRSWRVVALELRRAMFPPPRGM